MWCPLLGGVHLQEVSALGKASIRRGSTVLRNLGLLRPIYKVRFLLTIVTCDFCSARCSRHGKIVYDFHDIKLPVATIVVGF